MQTELTAADFDTLLEACEAWERKHEAGEALGNLMGAMLTRTDEERQKFQEESDKKKAAMEYSRRARKERSITLQAKLIALRDAQLADRLTTCTAIPAAVAEKRNP